MVPSFTRIVQHPPSLNRVIDVSLTGCGFVYNQVRLKTQIILCIIAINPTLGMKLNMYRPSQDDNLCPDEQHAIKTYKMTHLTEC